VGSGYRAGSGPIVAGVDKFFNEIVDWGMYLNPVATKVVPLSTATFMHAVGEIEIIAGIVILSRFTKLGSYVVMLWLLGISVNLVTTGMFFDLAMRDIELAIAAFALSQLSAARDDTIAVRQSSARVRATA